MVPPDFEAHYCRGCGENRVAFVFSVPGRHERDAKKPLSGRAGRNLDVALKRLNDHAPDDFHSIDRYRYRITNSFDEPIFREISNGKSEPSSAQVLSHRNVRRIIGELENMEVVILAGKKSQRLSEEKAFMRWAETSGVSVILHWHTGDQALVSKYSDCGKAKEASERQDERIHQWADELLEKYKKKIRSSGRR